MILLENRTAQIDDLLDKMAEELQLDKTRYERMKQHYEAVKNWIEGDEKFFKPFKYEVYPHGSTRIMTTVRPIGKDEFDLDIVLHLKTQWSSHTPQKIYSEVKRRLSENSIYKNILEPKRRCLRLNYSGDFHMDILPGVQENEWSEDMIRVPDRELGIWVSSNPRGYAKWFLDKANSVKVSLLEKALRAESLPVDDFENKKPLQRAVQLIKRYRDLYFQKNHVNYRTSSIVLTTIAGQFYNGEDSIFDAVDGIINRILSSTSYSTTRIKVLNPVNEREDFTDKWEEEPQYYVAFKAFCVHLYQEWQELKKEHGVITEGRILKGLFGDEIFAKAQNKQTAIVESYRNQNRLGINKASGTLSTSAIGTAALKPNTFYGE
jgi:hypothetical protein